MNSSLLIANISQLNREERFQFYFTGKSGLAPFKN